MDARLNALAFATLLTAGASAFAQAGSGAVVYRCPGPPVLYTDALTAAEARERNCRTIEGAPVTVIQGRPRTPPAASGAVTSGSAAARGTETRVDPSAQRSRDAEARRILGDELRREEERLAALKKEFNNGEPERRGDERNYQRYLDRVADLKAGILRSETDVAAIKRELGKLPP